MDNRLVSSSFRSNVYGTHGRWSFRCLVVLAVLMASFGQSENALAQIGVRSRTSQPTVINSFLPAPRELRQHLSRAETALQEKRYVDAVAQLGALLDKLDSARPGDDYSGDYFVGNPNEVGTRKSLRAEALRLLGDMPPAGLEAYELQYGADAKLMLEQAVEAGNVEQLAETSRRFFHTRAGYQATLLLGRVHLSKGRPLAAALCLKRLSDSSVASKRFEPELSMLLSTCWLLADMPESAEMTLLRLRRNYPNAEFTIGGEKIGLFQDDDQAIAWLTEVSGPLREAASRDETKWVMHRGNPQRNATVAGDVPLKSVRWYARLGSSDPDMRGIEEMYRRFKDQRLPVIPASHPLVVNDWVIYRTPWQLFGIQFSTGLRKWFFPGEQHLVREHGKLEGISQTGIGSAKMQRVQQRVWEDSPYGQMSTDGERVFMVDELGFVGGTAFIPPVLVARGGAPHDNPDWPKNHNTLVALDLKKEGSLAWIVGGENGDMEPRLEGAFFLGPPLPILKELYVLAEIKNEIRLVVLDAETGKLLWSQQLAHVESRTILHDPARRLAGASPSFADGVLVCPTSAGAVVAVDVSTRSLLWGYQYAQNTGNVRPGVWRVSIYRPHQFKPASKWDDSTATITDGKVILTPVESGEAFCLDLLTGKQLWKRSRGEDLFVGCVLDGRMLLVGKEHVTGVDVDSGKERYKTELPRNAMPSGRGFLSNGNYYVPTTAEEVVVVDVKSGKIEGAAKTSETLGNLICYKDTVISQGVSKLAAFRQVGPLEAEVTQKLKENPQDALALARQGELLLNRGRDAEALQALRKSYKIAPRDETRLLLVETLLAALQQDFEGNRQLASEVEQLVRRPDKRKAFLKLMAAGYESRGDCLQAFRFYRKAVGDTDGVLSNLHTPQRDGRQIEMIEVSPTQFVREDHWFQARLSELLTKASDTESVAINATIHDEYETVIKPQNGTPVQIGALRSFIDHYGIHELGESARLRLAEILLEEGDLLAAQVHLTTLAASSREQIAAPATALLATALTKLRQPVEREKALIRLATQFAYTPCCEGATGLEFARSFERATGEPYLQPWPGGVVRSDTSTKPSSGLSGSQRLYPLHAEAVADPLETPLRVSLDPQYSRIVVRDAHGRRTVSVPLASSKGQRFYSNQLGYSHGKYLGNLLLLSVGTELLAIDTSAQAHQAPDRRILWRSPLGSTPDNNGSSQRLRIRSKAIDTPWGDPRRVPADQSNRRFGSMAVSSPERLCFIRNGRLACVDPLTGEANWEWVDDKLHGATILADERYVIVMRHDRVVGEVLSAIDGRHIDTVTVPAETRRWVLYKRFVVTWDDEPGVLNLRLFDPAKHKDVWTCEFPVGTRGWHVGGDELALLTPDGDFQILSLDSVEARIAAALEPEPALSAVYVVRSQDQYIVVANTNAPVPRDGMNIQAVPPVPHSRLINGKVYALDRVSGTPLWPVPAAIEQFGLPLDQPAESPVLVFMRETRKVTRGRASAPQTSIVCIDRRDGRQVFRQDDLSVQVRAYELVVDEPNNRVELLLPDRSFSLAFTDEPFTPEPPLQMGEAASVVSDESRLERLTGALFKAFNRSVSAPQPSGSADPFGGNGDDPFGGGDPFGGEGDDPFQ